MQLQNLNDDQLKTVSNQMFLAHKSGKERVFKLNGVRYRMIRVSASSSNDQRILPMLKARVKGINK